MFAVIYRAYLKPGTEKPYKKAWKTIATYFVENQGALGSTLHKTPDDLWVAYSRWPSKEMRDASWPDDEAVINETFPAEIHNAIKTIKNSLDTTRPFPDITMEMVEQI